MLKICLTLRSLNLTRILQSGEQKTAVDALGAVKAQEGYIWSDQFYVYEKLAGDGCAIVGTTALAQNLQTLYVPAAANKMPITQISASAFAKCRALTMLIFASDSRLEIVEQKAFQKTLSLSLFYFYGNPPSIFPAAEDLGDPNALISASRDLVAAFQAAPAFASYSSRIGTIRAGEDALIEMFLEEVEEAEKRGIVQTSDLYFIYTLLPSGTWEVTALTELGKPHPL